MEDPVRGDEPAAGVETLKDRLDNLWEKYLQLLDRYDQAQKQLAKHSSSAFFSLAQANFKSPSRVRYGQDYYDERMQATRSVAIHSTESEQLVVSIAKPEEDVGSPKSPSRSATQENQKPTTKEPEQQPTPPSTPSPASHPDDAQEIELGSASAETTSASRSLDDVSKGTADSKKPRDPIQWFGILVPAVLRSCQGSFVSAVEGPIPEAANAVRGMREVEMEIRKLRKDIRRTEKRSKVCE